MRQDAKDLVNQKNLPTEPAINVGITTGAITGVLSLISLIFPDLLANKTFTACVITVAMFLPILTGFLVRGKVWSPASVLEVIQQATAEAIETERALHPKKDDPEVKDLPSI